MDNNRVVVDTRPCKGCMRGAPYTEEYDVETQCRICWLFEFDPRYTALWTGQPTEGIPKPKQPEAKINKDCVKMQQEQQVDFVNEVPQPRVRVGPSLARKAVNFTKAVVQHVAAGLPQSSEELIAKRKAICEGCELYVNESCVHKSCGCQMPVKWRWKDSFCPIAKW